VDLVPVLAKRSPQGPILTREQPYTYSSCELREEPQDKTPLTREIRILSREVHSQKLVSDVVWMWWYVCYCRELCKVNEQPNLPSTFNMDSNDVVRNVPAWVQGCRDSKAHIQESVDTGDLEG